MSVQAPSSPARARTRRHARRRRPLLRVPSRRTVVLAVCFVILAGLAAGLLFAGSPDRIASGVRIDGVNVGGMTSRQARSVLEQRSQAVLHVPVVFTVGGHRFRITADQLGVRVDWGAAVAAAQQEGDGFGPLRGLKRIDVRMFGADIAPQTTVYRGALDSKLQQLAREIDQPHREPALKLRGLQPVVVAGAAGRTLDRAAAAATIVRALASVERGAAAVTLPVQSVPPKLTATALAPAAAQVRRALSAPVRLKLGPTRFRLSRYRLASLLELPAGGSTQLRIGGPAATEWLHRLGQTVARPPRDAGFAVDGHSVRVVPARSGVALDAPGTAKAVLAAALRPAQRIADVPVAASAPKRTTEDARAMGITNLVSSYTTSYGGIPNRIHNVQLVAHLIDKTLIAPGATFSFNKTTGARTAAKGFLAAPVIINGELQTGLGGGVCQVSTTVFNTAFEAGVKITERVNHALYISHYPQGRDATVDYPDVDLKFVNDTGHWLLLRTFVGPSELTVNLYGAPLHRKVVSETSPLVTTGPAPLKKVVDPSLKPGEKVVADPGSPSLSTSVRRRVYQDGKLLYDDTWYSSYRASPKIVHIPPKPKKPKKPKSATTPGVTSPTVTSPAATSPTVTSPAATPPAATTPAATAPAATTPAATTPTATTPSP